MRTKTFLIAAISVISLLLAAAALALAKGKPDKPPGPRADYTVTTFANESTDAIKSDGQGSYDYRDSVINGRQIRFRPRRRQIYYNISNCLSGNCPESLEGFADPDFWIYKEMGKTFLDMDHGEVSQIYGWIELYPSKRENINLTIPFSPETENATVQAFNTDNVEGVDHWVFTIPEGKLIEVRHVREGETEFNASVPFTFTMDLY